MFFSSANQNYHYQDEKEQRNHCTMFWATHIFLSALERKARFFSFALRIVVLDFYVYDMYIITSSIYYLFSITILNYRGWLDHRRGSHWEVFSCFSSSSSFLSLSFLILHFFLLSQLTLNCRSTFFRWVKFSEYIFSYGVFNKESKKEFTIVNMQHIFSLFL